MAVDRGVVTEDLLTPIVCCTMGNNGLKNDPVEMLG